MAHEKEEKLQRILWLDTETTGLDHEVLRVLEIGWTVTDLDLDRDPTFVGVRALVLGSDPAATRMGGDSRLDGMGDFVRDMHTKNGLLALCADSPFNERNAESAILFSMENIERHYDVPIEWTLGGAGVSTFDMRVLEKWFPNLHAKLTYWTYDVSVVRRYMRAVFGIEETEQFKSESHRVTEDVRLALNEAIHFKNMMSDMRQRADSWVETAAGYAQNADYWKRRYELAAGPVDDVDVSVPGRIVQIKGDPTAEDLAFYDGGHNDDFNSTENPA